jgi:hypothetical protein
MAHTTLLLTQQSTGLLDDDAFLRRGLSSLEEELIATRSKSLRKVTTDETDIKEWMQYYVKEREDIIQNKTLTTERFKNLLATMEGVAISPNEIRNGVCCDLFCYVIKKFKTESELPTMVLQDILNAIYVHGDKVQNKVLKDTECSSCDIFFHSKTHFYETFKYLIERQNAYNEITHFEHIKAKLEVSLKQGQV